MLIQKIFHVNQSIQETKTRLGNINSYRRSLAGVNKAVVTADGVASFDFKTGTGFKAFVELNEIPTNNSKQILFRSYAGNVRVTGSIEYIQIRDRLTEVVLTIDYTIKSRLHGMIDLMTGSMDRFLNQQLKLIQSHMEGVAMFKIFQSAVEQSYTDTPHHYPMSTFSAAV